MVKVEIYRSKKGLIKSFKVTGHAGYKKHGDDIVCSAISILTQTALIGIIKVAEVVAEYEIKDDGYLSCILPEIESEVKNIKACAILETMYEGLINIEENYGKYIQISDIEEV